MARSHINVNVDTHGPLWNGMADRAVRDWIDSTKREVADMGVRELDAIVMDKTGRGTGQYQREIRTRTTGRYNDILIDDPVVYGPWLEGVSKRNESTRFKGYHLWRRTRQRLRRDFKDHAEERLHRYLEEMGGK